VIFEREAQGLATWFTTWTAPGEGDAIAKLLGDGIARRVWERALIIDCAAGVKGAARP
jgi:hypothetical protein